MIKRFISKVAKVFRVNRGAAAAAQQSAQPQDASTLNAPVSEPARTKQFGKASHYVYSEHRIDKHAVSRHAIRVCEMLQAQGFEAYVVGGAVRDLMLGLRPKDFDVATNATPEQVQHTFRRARIIGRRFRLVHVMFGPETIEVSTFRGNAGPGAETDEHGRVLRDNVFGSQAEDAIRRDFTVNALFYEPQREVVIDFVGGVQDLQAKQLRIIGDAATRYREDPVRMLRAVRFAAKLGFTIDPATRAPIAGLADILHNVPAARLFDEMLKLLTSGRALDCLHELRNAGLHHGLIPMLDVILEQPATGAATANKFVELALQSTDERIRMGKPVSPSFLFASLLWHQVLERWQRLQARGEHVLAALSQACDEVIEDQTDRLAIARRLTADMREIWMMQPRFEKRAGKAPYRMIEQFRFRAGYDFLLLREQAGELAPELGTWWTAFIDGDNVARAELIKLAAKAPKPPKPAKKSNAKPVPNVADGADTPEQDTEPDSAADGLVDEGGDTATAPKRRRRRRPHRKGNGMRGDGAGNNANNNAGDAPTSPAPPPTDS